jgi:histidinol dehydrogenase
VRLRELPVRRAAVYAPGGRRPYPSSVVMGAVTARVAGVDELVVAAPGHPLILAACALCGADEVYRMGGAQAIAALACGTETILPVDVIVGPGNLYVQEAKRQLSGRVGIDGFAGPSDLLVLASAGADPRLIALDLLAQAEHGEDSLVAVVSDDPALLDAVGEDVQRLFHDRPTVAGGPKVLIDAAGPDAALAFAEALAPEHLELIGEAAEALAPRVRCAGCLFVGAASATAFGDYVAGSNHTLPTGGAARFASGLTVAHFRRRMAELHVAGAARALARAGVPVAEAEGFSVHAESMSARIGDNPTP